MIPSSGTLVNRVHHLPLRVYYEDTDAGGIVYHSVYLQYAERGRTEMLRLCGLDQSALLAQTGVMAVVRRCTIIYFKPARLDDMLILKTHLVRTTGARLFFTQEISREGKPLVTIEVEIVFCSIDGRPTRVPQRVAALL